MQFELATQTNYTPVAEVMDGLRRFKSKLDDLFRGKPANVLEYGAYEL